MNDISIFRKKIQSNEDIYEIKLENVMLEEIKVKHMILKVNNHIYCKV